MQGATEEARCQRTGALKVATSYGIVFLSPNTSALEQGPFLQLFWISDVLNLMGSLFPSLKWQTLVLSPLRDVLLKCLDSGPDTCP